MSAPAPALRALAGWASPQGDQDPVLVARATGIVMALRRCDAEEALVVLTDAAERQDAPLNTVCRHAEAMVAGSLADDPLAPRIELGPRALWP
ncbi:ANTAR domain-containing protein [Cellulomonas denverensis]|uniref:ANTAR domain-containing protein n=1 Tax=Cellulomonas denverensis TaxID=264297 RepID=A0A7X6KWZ5_9CELL|nr:ANTAR domain-containing protein [Cellulomonas denverensis]NKY23420.1 ANTAR domain-containing protein [Cellulomonas denverensis]GIG25099.1 hypothetical protein Cde04nite_13430 [Cellulomonas denverensis]